MSLRAPFLAASVLLHGALLGGLWLAGPWTLERQQARADDVLVQASLEKARRVQLQRRVAALEQLQRELQRGAADADARRDAGPPTEAEREAGAPPPDPQALLARARQATEALERAERQARERELARLLGITPEQARQRLAPAAAASAPAGDASQQLAQLEQRAAQAASRLAAQEARARQGRAVQAGTAAAGGAGAPGDDATPGRGGGSAGAVAAATPLGGGGAFSDVRRYAAPAAVAVAAGQGRVGSARTLGAGGSGADRIVLDRWYIAGPFEARGPQDLHRVYPPELAVDLDAVYAGRGGRALRWRWSDEPGYPLVPQPRVENAVYYAYTEIRVDRPLAVWVDIGADDDSKLWLNGALVWVSGDGMKPWYRQPFYTLSDSLARRALVEGSRRVELQPGRNRLLFKLYNGIDLMFFSVVLRPAA